jgi:hypothetical protein
MKSLIINFAVIFLFISQANISFCTALPQAGVKGWKAGVARINITPEEPLLMDGYGSRNKPSEGALHDLWSKALVIEDSKGKKAVLITNDLVAIPKYYVDRIRDRIGAKYGLARSQIIINCSHTHAGPALYRGGRDGLSVSADKLKAKSYTEKFENQVVDMVGKAITSMISAQLFARNGVVRFQVNRNTNNERKIDRIYDLKGPNDYAVPVLKVINQEGNMIAVVFGYACHATTLRFKADDPRFYLFSGDYPGFAQADLERSFPGATALFFQGAGGDQNPLPRGSVPLAQQYGKELAGAVSRVLNENMKELAPVLETAYSEIELQYSGPPPDKEALTKYLNDTLKNSEIFRNRAMSMLRTLERGEQPEANYPSYPCLVWKLGDQAVMALGNELLVEYAINLKRLFGQDTFVMGYSNGAQGYMPSARALRTGAYDGLCPPYYFPLMIWNQNIEETILEEMKRLAEKAGVNQVK